MPPSITCASAVAPIVYWATCYVCMALQVVSRDIRRILTQRAAYFNIFLDDVSITQLTFSREYTHAVEAKQVAQQDAERARFIVSHRLCCHDQILQILQRCQVDQSLKVCIECPKRLSSSETAWPSGIAWCVMAACPSQVDKAEQDKQSAIIRAQGEAQSARLIGEAIQQNPAFLTLRKIEAARGHCWHDCRCQQQGLPQC